MDLQAAFTQSKDLPLLSLREQRGDAVGDLIGSTLEGDQLVVACLVDEAARNTQAKIRDGVLGILELLLGSTGPGNRPHVFDVSLVDASADESITKSVTGVLPPADRMLRNLRADIRRAARQPPGRQNELMWTAAAFRLRHGQVKTGY
jgi:hypothetical protein